MVEPAMPRKAPTRLLNLMALLSVAVFANSVSSASAQEVCPQADPDFSVVKYLDKFDVFFKNTQVYRIETNELNDLFGGKQPTISCEHDIKSRNVIGIVVGWKFDLLIAFGILRDIDGRAIRLNKLSWSPHSGSFDPIAVDGDEILAYYGNSWTRICWNLRGSQTWSFGTDSKRPPPHGECTTSLGPKGPSQYLISVPN